MITQKQAEEIVKRYSPTTKVIVNDSDSMDGIYLQKTDTISIAHNWSVAGLLHEITHAVLIKEGKSTGHDGIFADRFTKIVDDYYGKQIERLQAQLNECIEFSKILCEACDNEGILYPEHIHELEKIEKWGVK